MGFHGFCYLLVFLTAFLLPASTTAISTSSAIVRTLPGFSGSLPFKLETGYVSVGDSGDDELFYFFVESQGNPQKDPLLLYLVGGPYCSTLNPFFHTGPLKFDTTNYSDGFPTLSIREDAWTKVASIIYIDQPAGAGFSYSKNPKGPSRSSDTKSSKDLYQFMRKWLHDHQDFIDNEFYIVGESYSGVITPTTVQEIINGNKIGLVPQINLVGYILSSPITDTVLLTNSIVTQAYYMGLVSKPLYESAKRNCREEYVDVDPSNVDCVKDVNAISECTRGLDYWYVVGPKCQAQPDEPLLKPINNNLQLMMQRRRRSLMTLSSSSSSSQSSPPRSSSNSTKPVFTCEEDVFSYQSETWGNNQIVRSALNVDKRTRRLYRCNGDLQTENYDYDVTSAVDYHQNLTHTNLKVLVNGYTMKYQSRFGYSLTYATVKDSGHVPSVYKPSECYNMFKRWIRQDRL